MAGAGGAAPIALVYGGDLPTPHRMIGVDHVGFHLQADGACLRCTDGNKLSTHSSALQPACGGLLSWVCGQHATKCTIATDSR